MEGHRRTNPIGDFARLEGTGKTLASPVTCQRPQRAKEGHRRTDPIGDLARLVEGTGKALP